MQEQIQKILDLIGYTADKDQFIKEFIELVHLKTMQSVLLTFPEDKQKEISDQLVNANHEDVVKKVIVDNFQKELYSKMLSDTYAEMIREYIESIVPSLSKVQISELKNYFRSNLSPQTV
ncbi:MAG TPA: hypothetical protein PLD54_00460 [Candidatus Levybacteria bacterium]|nr:hypothetical protein [Candidatus Levybacteria bacterium]